MADFSFDTGGTINIWTRLATEILAFLEPMRKEADSVFDSRGPYLNTLDQIPALPDAKYISENLDEFMRGDTPAVLLQLGRSRIIKTNATLIQWDTDLIFHIFSGYPGDLINGRLDTDEGILNTGQDPGVRTIAQHVTEYVQGQRPALASSSILVNELRYQGSAPKWIWFSLGAQIQWYQQICLDRTAVAVDEIQVDHEHASKGVIASQRKTLF